MVRNYFILNKLNLRIYIIFRYINLQQDILNSGFIQAIKYYRFVFYYFFYFSSFSTSASCNTFRMGLKDVVNEYSSMFDRKLNESCHWLPMCMSSYDSYCSIQLMHFKHGWTPDPVFGFQPSSTEPSSSKANDESDDTRLCKSWILVELLEKQRSKLLKLLAKGCSWKQIGLAVWANGA